MKILLTLLWILAAIQAVLFGQTLRDSFRSNLETRALLTSEAPVRGVLLSAYRDLVKVRSSVPLGARVLVLDSGIVPVHYAYYFGPRRVTSLLNVTREQVETIRTVNEPLYTEVLFRFERFEGQGRLLTDESLAAELARSDFVVFYPSEIPVEVDGHELRFVLREGSASLYRVETDGRVE